MLSLCSNQDFLPIDGFMDVPSPAEKEKQKALNSDHEILIMKAFHDLVECEEDPYVQGIEIGKVVTQLFQVISEETIRFEKYNE